MKFLNKLFCSFWKVNQNIHPYNYSSPDTTHCHQVVLVPWEERLVEPSLTLGWGGCFLSCCSERCWSSCSVLFKIWSECPMCSIWGIKGANTSLAAQHFSCCLWCPSSSPALPARSSAAARTWPCSACSQLLFCQAARVHIGNASRKRKPGIFKLFFFYWLHFM